mmetsp:Transcript_1836/g.6040  ORF Transcript_1836/g.6040 Transcript_1836/m.6040 type:complete len:323 (-) Transcript_1836:1817-2785(-)
MAVRHEVLRVHHPAPAVVPAHAHVLVVYVQVHLAPRRQVVLVRGGLEVGCAEVRGRELHVLGSDDKDTGAVLVAERHPAHVAPEAVLGGHDVWRVQLRHRGRVPGHHGAELAVAVALMRPAAEPLGGREGRAEPRGQPHARDGRQEGAQVADGGEPHLARGEHLHAGPAAHALRGGRVRVGEGGGGGDRHAPGRHVTLHLGRSLGPLHEAVPALALPARAVGDVVRDGRQAQGRGNVVDGPDEPRRERREDAHADGDERGQHGRPALHELHAAAVVVRRGAPEAGHQRREEEAPPARRRRGPQGPRVAVKGVGARRGLDADL